MTNLSFGRIISLLSGVVCAGGFAAGVDLSGPISSTVTIYENSQLVGDVTCATTNVPCIVLGADFIKLRLNGFSITGPADPPSNCTTTNPFEPGDGIQATGRQHIEILGPGLVQKFRRHGIFVTGQSTRVRVRGLTSSHNCFSGIQFAGGTSDSDIEENVSVRNGIASANFSCGANCLVSVHNNRIRRNVFGGSGAVAPNNDFGVGLNGNSSGNVIEENAIVGNTNGVYIGAMAAGNLIRRNVIAGNPPVQLTATFGAFGGVDIRDLSPAGANTFEENLCVTYFGAGPAPCPNMPKFSGHHNAGQGSSQAP